MHLQLHMTSAGKGLAPALAVRKFLSALQGRSSGPSGPIRKTVLLLDSLSAFLFWDAEQVPGLLWPVHSGCCEEEALTASAWQALQLLEELTRQSCLSIVLALVHTVCSFNFIAACVGAVQG